MTDVLEDLPDDSDLSRAHGVHPRLDEDEQIWLVALAWIGRGTYDAKEWKEALAEARDQHNKRTAEYLTGLPLLGDYLEEGLAAFGEDCQAFTPSRKELGMIFTNSTP